MPDGKAVTRNPRAHPQIHASAWSLEFPDNAKTVSSNYKSLNLWNDVCIHCTCLSCVVTCICTYLI